MNKLKKIIENTVLTFLTLIIVLSGNLVLMILGLPVILVISSKILNVISNNKIKDSIFSVSKSGKIFQNALAQPLKTLKIIKSKDKKEIFIEEAKKILRK